MCGIWGVFPSKAGGFFQTDIPIIEQLMIVTSLRGTDSTGIAMVDDSAKKPRVYKAQGGPAYILNTAAWSKITDFLKAKAKVTFGHGRAATKGEVTIKNAHPFTYEHITLVHNGTIHFGLADEMKIANTEVDSHALAVAIAQKGIVNALADIQGAYALIVHDSKERCIYVVRNTERPLHRLITPYASVIMSESEALTFLVSRGKSSVVSPTVEFFPAHVIFKYDIATFTWTESNELKELMQKKYIPPTSALGWNGVGGVSQAWPKTSHGIHTTTSKPGDVTTYTKIELWCTGVTKDKTGDVWNYEFIDDTGLEYKAHSSLHRPDREGKSGLVTQFKKITDRQTGEITRFVFFRKIHWEDDPKTETPVVPQEDSLIKKSSYNGKVMDEARWMDLVKKNDCALCQGPVYHYEAHMTIVTDDGNLICRNCIDQGKHHSLGFNQ